VTHTAHFTLKFEGTERDSDVLRLTVTGDALAGERTPGGVVVVGDFQGRETVFADRLRLVAPALAALTAAQFVWCTHQPLFRE